jgi:hypothetical protein
VQAPRTCKLAGDHKKRCYWSKRLFWSPLKALGLVGRGNAHGSCLKRTQCTWSLDRWNRTTFSKFVQVTRNGGWLWSSWGKGLRVDQRGKIAVYGNGADFRDFHTEHSLKCGKFRSAKILIGTRCVYEILKFKDCKNSRNVHLLHYQKATLITICPGFCTLIQPTISCTSTFFIHKLKNTVILHSESIPTSVQQSTTRNDQANLTQPNLTYPQFSKPAVNQPQLVGPTASLYLFTACIAESGSNTSKHSFFPMWATIQHPMTICKTKNTRAHFTRKRNFCHFWIAVGQKPFASQSKFLQIWIPPIKESNRYKNLENWRHYRKLQFSRPTLTAKTLSYTLDHQPFRFSPRPRVISWPRHWSGIFICEVSQCTGCQGRGWQKEERLGSDALCIGTKISFN